ncbi:MAG: ribonuclease J [Oscillospiraceae bacterium]|nr:ribonuclease J [Oscillospiraceae bacterium]
MKWRIIFVTTNEKRISDVSGARNEPRGRQAETRQNGNSPKMKNSIAAQGETEQNTAKKAQASSKNTNSPNRQVRHRGRPPKNPAQLHPVRLTMLGGLNEIGKNITMLEYGDDAFLIDCGMAFPDEDMLGVDIVIPDFTHVIKNIDRVQGIVLTHGHEDHIGGLPYLLKQVNLPLYGTRLTLALVESKLKESGLSGKVKLNEVKPGDVVTFGSVSVEFINVNHSIPDAIALGIKTPLGYVVHTGDFKIDFTPIIGQAIDLPRFGAMGNEGVLALLADSTNSERPGYTPSERVVGESFTNLFHRAENKRIIIATFSSNIHRIRQIIDVAVADGRKVAISGRSMVNVVSIAKELGYLQIPEGVLIDIDTLNRYPKEKVILITTGSQGEPMSALSRMAFSDHRKVEVGPDDYIIISATPIPGNEKTVTKVINELMKLGCDVVFEKMYDVHVSGHACQEELKIMHGLTRPKFFIPVHGEQKHMRKSAQLARSMGMRPNNVLIPDIGKVIEITADKMQIVGTVPAGRLLVDGLGVGDVGSIVLRDRKHLAEDGLIVVVATIDNASGELIAGPDIVSRGFVYVREAEPLIEEARNRAREVLEDCCREHILDWSTMKSRVRDELSHLLFQKTKRSPMILPIIMDV